VAVLPKTCAVLLMAAACLPLAAADASPAAPRNGRIVFQRFDPAIGATRLYIVQPDGRTPRALTRPAGVAGVDSAAPTSASISTSSARTGAGCATSHAPAAPACA
jgi:hypothetical protein